MSPRPPLSTRECAELIGVSRFFILDAIKAGELKAEKVCSRPGGRPMYRVHEDDYFAWLVKMGWSRMPVRRAS
jgi:excisionase family DNA binding protein